jgi:transitional endoplasmic reticulum ATPase
MWLAFLVGSMVQIMLASDGLSSSAPSSFSMNHGENAHSYRTNPVYNLHLRGGNVAPAKDADEPVPADKPVKKISANRLLAQAPTTKDNSIVGINSARMEQLGFFNGDTILIKGRRGKETCCVVVPDEKLQEDGITLPAVVSKTLRVKVGEDRVKVSQFPDIKNAKRVHILPFKDTLGSFTGDVFEVFLKPYFFENYRPLHVGEVFPVRVEELDQTVDFKVMQIDDDETKYGVVAPESIVYTEGNALDREEDPAHSAEVGYDDIGGLKKQLHLLRELVEMPLKHPELFQRVGVKPPRGVLLFGPAGCGKTIIGQALASETGAFFFLINGPEVMSGKAGESEGHLRRCFDEAIKNSPAIIWIDEVDTIAPKRDKANGEVEKRIVSQLLTLMDGLTASTNVMVIAATNKPNTIDGALRRFGRFSKEIEVCGPRHPHPRPTNLALNLQLDDLVGL